MNTRGAIAAAIVLAATAGALALGVARQSSDQGARCGPGFAARGARCVGAGTCPAPLVARATGCDAPDVRVLVPATAVAVGPSDWEAEGRVQPRSIRVEAFRIDAFEVTRGAWVSGVSASARGGSGGGGPGAGGGGASAAAPVDDAARAASGMTRAEAAAFCEARGGRLPTEDEWMVAAVSAMNPPRRYPWGDTGAVCRRAAWGLAEGPCARGLREAGPDTVGAHPDGDSPLGIHDLAGNVAEWVSDGSGAAKGGSFSTALAADLRVWARLDVSPEAHDSRVGLRCVYPP